VKRSCIFKRQLATLLIAIAALLCGPGIGSAGRAHKQPENSVKFAAPCQKLSADSQATLRAIDQAGNLADLRWPDFSDYEKHVQKFYESYSYSLPWVKEMEPTPQARQVISVLLQADPKRIVRGRLRWVALG
jgi:hypothetical protein